MAVAADTLVLDGDQVRALLPVEDCIAAVAAGFRRMAEGGASPPGVLGIEARGGHGGFHLKAAALELTRSWFAAKLNANFPANPSRHGLPTIQGVVALCDGDNGRVLALLDSSEITRLRTGAASALAARHLARPDSTTLTLFGCGLQGRAQLECLSRVLPLTRVVVTDLVPAAAAVMAGWVRAALGLECRAVDAAAALRLAAVSDVVVTCTPARRFFLTRECVRPGCFIAAVGADAPGKQELEPELLAGSRVVADVLEQCATIGDLHHALVAGVLRREDIHAELAEVVTGRKPGRTDASQIFIFDSTGTAIEDVAAAAMTYERAVARGLGTPIRLASASDPPKEAI